MVKLEQELTSESLDQIFLMSWSHENKSYMRVDESLYESFLNFHVLLKREEELHQSWRLNPGRNRINKEYS